MTQENLWISGEWLLAVDEWPQVNGLLNSRDERIMKTLRGGMGKAPSPELPNPPAYSLCHYATSRPPRPPSPKTTCATPLLRNYDYSATGNFEFTTSPGWCSCGIEVCISIPTVSPAVSHVLTTHPRKIYAASLSPQNICAQHLTARWFYTCHGNVWL